MKRLTEKAKWLLPLAILGISAITILASSSDNSEPGSLEKGCKVLQQP